MLQTLFEVYISAASPTGVSSTSGARSMARLTLDPEIPAHSLDNAAAWLLCWAAISVFIIIPAIHYFVVTMSRRLAGYRALPAGQQVDWNQSATMTLIMPTLLFVAFARAHWVCSGSVHSRANCYLPWTRSGACCCSIRSS